MGSQLSSPLGQLRLKALLEARLDSNPYPFKQHRLAQREKSASNHQTRQRPHLRVCRLLTFEVAEINSHITNRQARILNLPVNTTLGCSSSYQELLLLLPVIGKNYRIDTTQYLFRKLASTCVVGMYIKRNQMLKTQPSNWYESQEKQPESDDQMHHNQSGWCSKVQWQLNSLAQLSGRKLGSQP